MSLTRPPPDQCITTTTATIWLDPRGFVVVDQVPRALQTWETAAEMLHATRKALPGDAPIAVLVLSNESRTDRGGRRAFAEIGGKQNACVALVVQSKVSEVTGNFFLRINKPPYPMRLFDDVEEAAEWAATHVVR
ncbi:MAG: hypothetical protein H6737_31940 [Alphaproteobacteria bacterium]|nr:hypothetical protein [Alphaproteobacteria bacterium]